MVLGRPDGGLPDVGRTSVAKPKETPHLRLRVSPALLARLERAREKTGRTLTGEIVHRLEQTFRREENLDQTGEMRAAVQAAIKELFRGASIVRSGPTDPAKARIEIVEPKDDEGNDK
jgi:hypothetical protein